MVDIIRTVKSIMDAHGAWIFGGAVLGALTTHIHKKRSFDADWFQVTCYGCGRSGFSDEFAGVTTPDGRPAYQCIRCQRPDLFRQAEADESFEDFRRRMVGDAAIAGDMGYMEALEEYYQDYLEEFESRQKEMCPDPMTFEQFQERVLKNDYDYEMSLEAEFVETPDTIAAYNQGFADCEAEAKLIPLLIDVIEDDPHDYEIDDYLLIVDGEVREVSGNTEMDYLDTHGYDIPYHIVSIDVVNPYQITIQDSHDGESFDAEGVDYSTIVYRVRIRDVDGESDGENYHYRTANRAMEHVNNVIAAYDWYGFKEIPTAGERRKWKTTSGEDWEIMMTPIRLGNIVREAETTNPCQHCEGAAGFPREFYYQSDRIEMVPCGTCLTQGRCPGCMEIYPGLTRDNTPEDVFFGSGCDRCGYSESDAREARKTARRWVELVDNPAAARFMAEGSPLPKPKTGLFSRKPKLVKVRLECRPGDPTFSEVQHRLAEGGYMMLPHDEIFSESVWVMLVSGDDAAGVGYINNIPINPKYELGQLIEWDMRDVSIIEDATPESIAMMEAEDEDSAWSELMVLYGDYVDSMEGVKGAGIYQRAWYVPDPDEEDVCLVCQGVSDPMCMVVYALTDDADAVMDGKAEPSEQGEYYLCDLHAPQPFQDSMDAEDYGVGAVWMADSYDPAIHGNTIPTGSVKRFLDKIPTGQMFHVDFVKSNGDIREMDAFFNKPFDTDSMIANVMERTGTGAVFKRFRVDRVVGLYRI